MMRYLVAVVLSLLLFVSGTFTLHSAYLTTLSCLYAP